MRKNSCQVICAARAKAIEQLKRLGDDAGQYVPWPKSLSDYLQKELRSEYELRHFVLDRARFNNQFEQTSGYTPLPLTSDQGGSAAVLRSLICVDCLDAQRHLADTSASSIASSGRAEDLSKLLSRFYKRNLDQREDDQNALARLIHRGPRVDAALACAHGSAWRVVAVA